MRIRALGIDPIVGVTALLVTAFGFIFGLGLWSVAVGLLILVVARGSGQSVAWVKRQLAMPPTGTAERTLINRSWAAAAVMAQLVQSVPDGPVAQRCKEMERQALGGLPTIDSLGLQAFRVRALAASIPVDRLEMERVQTTDLLAAKPEERLRIELDSSLRSTEAQLRAGRRLRTLADELLARTRALTTSMEAVAAGLAELQALSSSDPTNEPQIALANLSREIDALRGGLEEAQTFGRRAAAIHGL